MSEATRPEEQGQGLSDAERYDRGMVVRREVLSDAHVDRANASISEFTADFQDFITRTAWGDIWSRPGLDRRSRSVAVLTAMIALGHHEGGAREDCRLAVARTVDGDASAYYRITSFDPSTAGAANGYVVNDQDANDRTVVWAVSQADAAAARKVMTTDGFTRKEITTDEVDVPTSKAELLAWLTANMK